MLESARKADSDSQSRAEEYLAGTAQKMALEGQLKRANTALQMRETQFAEAKAQQTVASLSPAQYS